jgi:hypothetical protein
MLDHWIIVWFKRDRCERYVALMIWGFDIYAVPTCGEGDCSADATFAKLGGKGACVVAGTWCSAEWFEVCSEASVAYASIAAD